MGSSKDEACHSCNNPRQAAQNKRRKNVSIFKLVGAQTDAKNTFVFHVIFATRFHEVPDVPFLNFVIGQLTAIGIFSTRSTKVRVPPRTSVGSLTASCAPQRLIDTASNLLRQQSVGCRSSLHSLSHFHSKSCASLFLLQF
jgi:hypothetical protein